MVNFIPSNINIDFLKISRPFVIGSTLVVIASFIALFVKGPNYGIDFRGGAEVQVRVAADWDIGRVRNELTQGGLKDLSVVQIGNPTDHEYLIKLPAHSEADIKSAGERVEGLLKPKMSSDAYKTVRVDVVGPRAGENLQIDAILSLIYAGIGILIYITFRFDSRFAPGMIRALFFDVAITLGVWIFLGKEFSLTTIAAFLTIAGYSCNDTIVIYDRIRDMMKMHPDWNIEKIINRAINVNLGRTILTTGCTLFVVISMWVFGGAVLSDFAFALLIGFTVGALSTIFVANSLIMWMEKRRLAKLSHARAR